METCVELNRRVLAGIEEWRLNAPEPHVVPHSTNVLRVVAQDLWMCLCNLRIGCMLVYILIANECSGTPVAEEYRFGVEYGCLSSQSSCPRGVNLFRM